MKTNRWRKQACKHSSKAANHQSVGTWHNALARERMSFREGLVYFFDAIWITSAKCSAFRPVA